MSTNLKKIEPEADGIVKDGQSISVSMMMMDEQQKAVATSLTDKPIVSDHHGPHSASLSDAQRAAAIECQIAADKRLSDAWRNPPSMFVPQDLSRTPPEVTKPVAFGEGRFTADKLEALQQSNQKRYNKRIEDAWRNPANHGV